MAIRSFGHLGVTVSSMDRALAFYCGVLGLEDTGTRLELKGDFISTLQGIPDVQLRAAVLRTPDGVAFELLAYDSPGGFTRNPLRCSDVGGFHACFMVDSVDDEYARLKAAGIDTFTAPPLDYQQLRVMYFADPDGNTLEMISRGA